MLLAPSLALERIFQASEEIVLAMAGFDQQWQRQNLLSRRCFLMAKRDPLPKMCEQVRSLLIHLTRLLVRWMGGVGHRARVSKAQRAKSRGSKNFQLEVGAQRVPRLLNFPTWWEACQTPPSHGHCSQCGNYEEGFATTLLVLHCAGETPPMLVIGT